MGAGRFSSLSALLSLQETHTLISMTNRSRTEQNKGARHVGEETHSGRVPDNLSFFFSDEVLKSTPPKPTLRAGATGAVAATDEDKPPKVRPPPRADCPRPETQHTQHRVKQQPLRAEAGHELRLKNKVIYIFYISK